MPDTDNQEPKTFDEDYVKGLRTEAASYRVKAKELQSELEKGSEKATKLQSRLLEKEITNLAKTHNVVDPQTLMKLLDNEKFSIDEDCNFSGLEEHIKEIVTSKPFLTNQPIGKGSNTGDNGQSQVFTRAQVDRMTAQEINDNWPEIQSQMSKGLIR